MISTKRRRIDAAAELLDQLPDDLALSAVSMIESLSSSWNKLKHRDDPSIIAKLPPAVLRMCVGFSDMETMLAWTKTCREAHAHKHNKALVAKIRHQQEVADLPLKREICQQADRVLCGRMVNQHTVEQWFKTNLNANLRELQLTSEFKDQASSSTEFLARHFQLHGSHEMYSPVLASGTINPFAWVDESGAVVLQSDANTALEKQMIEALRESMRRLRKAPLSVFREHWTTDLRFRQTGTPTQGKAIMRGAAGASAQEPGVKTMFAKFQKAAARM